MAEEILRQRTRVTLRAIRQQVIGKPAVLARVSGIEGAYGLADPEAEVPALDFGGIDAGVA